MYQKIVSDMIGTLKHSREVMFGLKDMTAVENINKCIEQAYYRKDKYIKVLAGIENGKRTWLEIDMEKEVDGIIDIVMKDVVKADAAFTQEEQKSYRFLAKVAFEYLISQLKIRYFSDTASLRIIDNAMDHIDCILGIIEHFKEREMLVLYLDELIRWRDVFQELENRFK